MKPIESVVYLRLAQNFAEAEQSLARVLISCEMPADL